MVSHPSKSCHEVLTHFVDVTKSFWNFPGNLTSCCPILCCGQILIHILRVSWQCEMHESDTERDFYLINSFTIRDGEGEGENVGTGIQGKYAGL